MKNSNENPKKEAEKGNMNDDNNNQKTPEMIFAVLKGKHYCCGKAWHTSPTCRLKGHRRDRSLIK
jgi:hypothetical protein